MNSSAITKSASPTISIPGQTAAASSDVSFGNVMEQITDNWADRNTQIRHDAAKTAQLQTRDNTDARRNTGAEKTSRDDYTRADTSRNDTRTNKDDHKTYDDVDAASSRDDTQRDDHRDVADSKNDPGRDDHDTRDTDSRAEGTDAQSDQPKEVVSADSDQQIASTDDTATSADPAQQGDQIVDPNMAAIPGINPAAQQATVQAGAQVVSSATAANASTQPVTGTPAQNAEGTTGGLMNSTALSQPAAGATAKSALNGQDGSTEAADSNDSFISKIVDAMSGERSVKAGTETANAGTNANTSNTNGNATTGQQTAATSGAVNGSNQVAQQALAGAANMQTAQPAPQPQAAAIGNTTAAVSATGNTEGSTQAANGPLTGNSSLTQSNSTGQTAQTARNAPAQQVQQQVAVHIRNAASEGVDKISVQLRPEHLGRVDVKLEIGHDGRVQGVIQADTRETLDLLRQDSRALQQALKDAGLNADSQSFTFEQRNQGGQGQDSNDSSRMANKSGSTPDEGDVLTGAELAEHVAIGYGINPNGLVDIRI
ncbi:flagellar hook-length control protein FliK [Thalassospira alkalitolerans]|uniref:Flagellar hook-length control protein-like C-terminal domain-containing protein n=1 Tax=Thalassospira alkalitolerans TaxID=1293890 RepID=A0A1Y2L6A4_9PROT|nr:flagellar hook-length control protein FliK [Thalassospira alkalitolerans]OSQ43741.1 hypothetical protein TALK_20010 [Thalassospira alkalitolerans]